MRADRAPINALRLGPFIGKRHRPEPPMHWARRLTPSPLNSKTSFVRNSDYQRLLARSVNGSSTVQSPVADDVPRARGQVANFFDDRCLVGRRCLFQFAFQDLKLLSSLPTSAQFALSFTSSHDFPLNLCFVGFVCGVTSVRYFAGDWPIGQATDPSPGLDRPPRRDRSYCPAINRTDFAEQIVAKREFPTSSDGHLRTRNFNRPRAESQLQASRIPSPDFRFQFPPTSGITACSRFGRRIL